MIRKMRFSKTEIKHLLIAWLVISLAFGIVINDSKFTITLLRSILLAGLTVGVGFLIHELSHKAVAQHYHCLAEFRANFQMLFLAVLMSFFGFVFAAPGAVMIFGYVSRKQNGLISLAGPLSNLVIAALLLPLYFLTSAGIIHQIAQYGFWINSFLALFNMIPFGMFDGYKIIKWNKWIFAGMIIVSGVFTFIAFLPMFR
ncbi:MAG: metalloprotease [Nanoarchaeota archaeon]